jgi:hypothetical protein
MLWQHIMYPLASLHEKQRTQIHDMLLQHYCNETFILLTRDFSQELYVLPDDDKRYTIEICKSSESVLEKCVKSDLSFRRRNFLLNFRKPCI